MSRATDKAERERAQRRAAAIADYNSQHVIPWDINCELIEAASGTAPKNGQPWGWREYIQSLSVLLYRRNLMKYLDSLQFMARVPSGHVQSIRLLKTAYGMPLSIIPGPFCRDTWLQHHFANELLDAADAWDEPTAKGKPGRRGYSLEALKHAQALRRRNPDLKAWNIRALCLERFSEDELPLTEDAFRRWLNRPRKNRAN